MAVRGTGHVGSHSQGLSLPPPVGPGWEAGKEAAEEEGEIRLYLVLDELRGKDHGKSGGGGCERCPHPLSSSPPTKSHIPTESHSHVRSHDNDYFSTSVHTIT